jgi:hypothetical protein
LRAATYIARHPATSEETTPCPDPWFHLDARRRRCPRRLRAVRGGAAEPAALTALAARRPPALARRRRARHGQHARRGDDAALRLAPLAARRAHLRGVVRALEHDAEVAVREPVAEQAQADRGVPFSAHAFNSEAFDAGAEPQQQGTQIDALGHFASIAAPWDPKNPYSADGASYYGGYKQKDVKPTPDSPLLKLGIEKIPPLVTTAVLLDAKSLVGKGKAMADGELVTAAHIEAMLKAQGLGKRGILPGDMVWIYTGWSENWKDGDDGARYYAMAPGLSVDAAKLLATKRIVAIGSTRRSSTGAERHARRARRRRAGHRAGPSVLDPPLHALGVRHPPPREPQPRRDGEGPGLDLVRDGSALARPGRRGRGDPAGRDRPAQPALTEKKEPTMSQDRDRDRSRRADLPRRPVRRRRRQARLGVPPDELAHLRGERRADAAAARPLARAVRERPSPKSRGLPRHDRILQIDQASPTAAFVKLQCAIPPRYFTDYLSLLKVEGAGRWRRRSSRPSGASSRRQRPCRPARPMRAAGIAPASWADGLRSLRRCAWIA